MTLAQLWHALAVDQEPLAEEAEVDFDTSELDPCFDEHVPAPQVTTPRKSGRSFLRIIADPRGLFR